MKFLKRIVLMLMATIFTLSTFTACDIKDEGKTVAEKEVFSKVDFGLNESEKQIDLLYFDGGKNTSINYFSAQVLQGLINKTKPRVYISFGFGYNGVNCEAEKMKILQQYGNVTLSELAMDNQAEHQDAQLFWTLFKKYGGEVKKMFVFPTNATLQDTKNVAAMLAGRNQGIAVSKTLAEQIVKEGYDLPQIDVLEYMGMTTKTANYLTINNWIADNLVEGANKTMVFAAVPGGRGGSGNEGMMPNYYDLIVASDAVVYDAQYTYLEAGVEFQKKILDQYPDCTPVMGWCEVYMETTFVSTISACGKVVCGFDWHYPNGSIWGAFPEYKHETPINGEIPDYTAENGKIYVSFMMSDGDAWHYQTRENIGNWVGGNRGTYPMGWSTASILGVCNPLLMEYYYSTATDMDEFMQGPSGIFYAYASLMPARSYENYLKLTKEAFDKMGITMVNYWDFVGSDTGVANSLVGGNYSLLEKYVEIVKPDLLSRGHNSLTGEWQLVGDTVVIEQIGSYWGRNGVDSLGGMHNDDDIVGSLEYFRQNKLTSDAPLFIMVNVEAWGEGVQMVPEAIDRINASVNASSYVFVKPSEMVGAIRNYKG